MLGSTGIAVVGNTLLAIGGAVIGTSGSNVSFVTAESTGNTWTGGGGGVLCDDQAATTTSSAQFDTVDGAGNTPGAFPP